LSSGKRKADKLKVQLGRINLSWKVVVWQLSSDVVELAGAGLRRQVSAAGEYWI
jgi:hypothetical protein